MTFCKYKNCMYLRKKKKKPGFEVGSGVNHSNFNNLDFKLQQLREVIVTVMQLRVAFPFELGDATGKGKRNSRSMKLHLFCLLNFSFV